MKVVIIGGVAGGASAAARLRRLDESAEIVMVERTGYVSYANCGLPYYVGGVIADRAELTLQTPERFRERFNIDVRVGSEVTAINREAKTVSVREAETGRIYEEPYDKLILAPGAAPVVPAAVSLDSPRVFTLRTVEDALALRAFVTEKTPRRAVVVGGGFIGIEAAENLVEMGVETTLVQRPAQLLKPLDADMAAFVHAEMGCVSCSAARWRRWMRTPAVLSCASATARRCRPIWWCSPSAWRPRRTWPPRRGSPSASAAASPPTRPCAPPTRTSSPWAMPWR